MTLVLRCLRAFSAGVLLAVCCAVGWAASPDVEVRRLIQQQESDWNRGDIRSFMTTYEKSSETTFYGASGVQQGWDRVLARYIERYPNRETMGHLRFEIEQVRTLTPDVALALGQFHLTRTERGGGNANGHFTLVFRRGAAGWRIVHDHTGN